MSTTKKFVGVISSFSYFLIVSNFSNCFEFFQLFRIFPVSLRTKVFSYFYQKKAVTTMICVQIVFLHFYQKKAVFPIVLRTKGFSHFYQKLRVRGCPPTSRELLV